MTKPRLLVAYSNAATFVPTTMEYLNSFRLHSSCDVSYLHVTHGAEVDLDLNQFDAVFHSYCARLCFTGLVSQSYLEALQRFRGVRLMAVQDEYDHTSVLRQAIRELAFDVVFTCVPPQGREIVYPSALFPDTEFVTVLTDYVPEMLKARGRGRVSIEERPITIGYRGRSLPARYGRLGLEKFEIGRRVREICAARGIVHDIDMSEEKRIYGDAWYDFLGRCRATLGTESGSNVFDFDGSLTARYEALKARNNREPTHEEFRPYTDPLEDMVQMGQVSPRVFEAAALGTPMILFSGRYSGAVAPGEHYIELRKDFGNIDAVLDQVADIPALARLADRAYDHLIASGDYDYRRFVATVDETIERKHVERAGVQSLGIQPAGMARVAEQPGDALVPTRREMPTAAPRESVYFRYKDLYFEHEWLKDEFVRETARLTEQVLLLERELAGVRQLYDAERARGGRWSPARLKQWMAVNLPLVTSILRRVRAGLRFARVRPN